jgi:hypothetical protein
MNPSTGAITGLPTATNAATTYTVTVTDRTAPRRQAIQPGGQWRSHGLDRGRHDTLTQNHANPPFTPVTGGGGTTPYTYSVLPTLPAGLSLGIRAPAPSPARRA